MWLRRLALLERTAQKSSEASLSGFSHSTRIPDGQPRFVLLMPVMHLLDFPAATIRPRPPAHAIWAHVPDCSGACSHAFACCGLRRKVETPAPGRSCCIQCESRTGGALPEQEEERNRETSPRGRDE